MTYFVGIVGLVLIGLHGCVKVQRELIHSGCLSKAEENVVVIFKSIYKYNYDGKSSIWFVWLIIVNVAEETNQELNVEINEIELIKFLFGRGWTEVC